MIKSMTGFGRGSYSDGLRQCTVEIKTVNHRYSDISVKIPRVLMQLEDKIRKMLQGYVTRGKTDVYVTYIDMSEGAKKVIADQGLIGAYYDAIKNTSEKMGLKFEARPEWMLRIPDAFVVETDNVPIEEVWGVVQEAVKQAAENLTEMRQKEGQFLINALERIIDEVEILNNNVKQRSPAVPLEYKEKLEARLKELLTIADVDPQRLAAEVAVFADKCSIEEEITRMEGHIKHFRDIMKKGNDSGVGRRLDFLVQEMNREANTMGSKANDAEIINNVISLKSSIEKIREQIQNIE